MNRQIYSFITLILLGVCATTPSSANDENLVFGYCGDVAFALGSRTPGQTVAAAIQIPESVAQSWGNASLTEVQIGYGTSSVKDVTVFLTRGLEETPFYTQDATITFENGWNTVKLDQPIEIDGSAFFVGYETKGGVPSDLPIGVDNITTDQPYGDYANVYDEWENIGPFYGNVCVKIGLTGGTLPQYDVTVNSLELPFMVLTDTDFSGLLNITNNGLKTVNDITVDCTIDGVKLSNPVVTLPEGPIPSGESGTAVISGLNYSEVSRSVTVEVTLTSLNGNDDESPIDNTVSSSFGCARKTFKQNVLIEEFTGTWCGNCPVGIVGMGYMREKYGNDGFVGIAVHAGDEMQIDAYYPVVEKFAYNGAGLAFPASVINRKQTTYPAAENLEYYYLEMTKYPAAAGITLKADYDEDEDILNVTSDVEFSFDEEKAKYAIAFVITEDNFGPYDQLNYFSGGAQGGLEGWNNLPGTVSTYFNEVAREIKNTWGISGSIPSSLEAMKPYSYQTTLSLNNVRKLEGCEVVAMLVDTSSMEVINVAKAEIKTVNAGVESILNQASDGVYCVYTLQGLKVLETTDPSVICSLPKGIYIVNGKKIVI